MAAEINNPFGNNLSNTSSSAASLVNSAGKEAKGSTGGIFGAIGDNVSNPKAKAGLYAVSKVSGDIGDGLLQASANMPSDEATKNASMNSSDARVDALAKINSYDFTYKPRLRDTLGVDDKEHTGVMAQELEANPLFKGVVEEDPSTGYKMLDIKSLTAANTAAIGDLARKINELERIINNGR